MSSRGTRRVEELQSEKFSVTLPMSRLPETLRELNLQNAVISSITLNTSGPLEKVSMAMAVALFRIMDLSRAMDHRSACNEAISELRNTVLRADVAAELRTGKEEALQNYQEILRKTSSDFLNLFKRFENSMMAVDMQWKKVDWKAMPGNAIEALRTKRDELEYLLKYSKRKDVGCADPEYMADFEGAFQKRIIGSINLLQLVKNQSHEALREIASLAQEHMDS